MRRDEYVEVEPKRWCGKHYSRPTERKFKKCAMSQKHDKPIKVKTSVIRLGVDNETDLGSPLLWQKFFFCENLIKIL